MSASRDYLDYLTDALAPMGRVAARRMFGGAGLFLDGLMFAIVIDDQLWLKVDDDNRADFLARDLPPFTYARQGREVSLSYYRAPDETLDAPEALIHWCRSAFAAALRSSVPRNTARKPKTGRAPARRSAEADS